MTNKKLFFSLSLNKLFPYNIYFFIFINIIITIKTSKDTKNIIVIPFKYYKPKIISEKETKQEKLLTSWL